MDDNVKEGAMRYEDIYEAIEVVTYFREGKIVPLKFRWNGRIYIVKHVSGQWKERTGNMPQYHFSIQSDSGDYFELLFDTDSFFWQIARVCLDG